MFNVMRMLSEKTTPSLPHRSSVRCQTTSDIFVRSDDYMAFLFIFMGWMPLLVPTLENADPLFELVMTPGFFLHHVEVWFAKFQ